VSEPQLLVVTCPGVVPPCPGAGGHAKRLSRAHAHAPLDSDHTRTHARAARARAHASMCSLARRAGLEDPHEGTRIRVTAPLDPYGSCNARALRRTLANSAAPMSHTATVLCSVTRARAPPESVHVPTDPPSAFPSTKGPSYRHPCAVWYSPAPYRPSFACCPSQCEASQCEASQCEAPRVLLPCPAPGPGELFACFLTCTSGTNIAAAMVQIYCRCHGPFAVRHSPVPHARDAAVASAGRVRVRIERGSKNSPGRK
jgi:hypothetical protein